MFYSILFYNYPKLMDLTILTLFKKTKNSLNNNYSHKLLKKCGRKMMKICDIDKDKALSLKEWMNCVTTTSHEG